LEKKDPPENFKRVEMLDDSLSEEGNDKKNK